MAGRKIKIAGSIDAYVNIEHVSLLQATDETHTKVTLNSGESLYIERPVDEVARELGWNPGPWSQVRASF